MIDIARRSLRGHPLGVTSLENIPWFTSASRRKRWLVGVSGGADSVALLRLLVAAGFKNLVVCHLDHRLRGRASAADAKFVKHLAELLGVKYEIGTAHIEELMAASKASMETAARDARHQFFAQCAKKHGCPRVLLAHHAEDQAETVLWNLLRGSNGLKGMRAEQKMVLESGAVLELSRPLLAVRRADLLEWLRAGGHAWREDGSNRQPIAVRNRLRNEVFPLLEEIAKRDVIPCFVRGAGDCEDAETLETWALAQANVLDPQGRLHLPVLRSLPLVLQRLALVRFLKENSIGTLERGLIERALDLLDVSKPAVINLPGGGKLRRRAGRLWVEC